jgi:protein involved in polysaccharide export with SLBB domain
MRKRLFNRIKAGGKGGRPGQWSARKAQMLAQAYKKAGGGYRD